LDKCELDPLTEKEQEFIRVVELAAIDQFLEPYRWVGNGRKPEDRKGVALAFIAKAVWNFPKTVTLIDDLKASRNVPGSFVYRGLSPVIGYRFTIEIRS